MNTQLDIDDYYRLFPVAGMNHCRGGDGANSFGNQVGRLPPFLLQLLPPRPPNRLTHSHRVWATRPRTTTRRTTR
jgi:hypothetical protein